MIRSTIVITVLDAVSAISISAGATLKAEGEAIALDKLMIDATDAGTVDGFAFAASGTLEIVNAPAHGDVELPAVFANVSGLSNLRNWTCSVNGEPMKRQLRIVDGKFFLRVSGLRLLVR